MNLAVFDVDGTLLDNLADEEACYAHALREQLRLKKLDTDWARYTHVSDDGIATEAYAREFGQSLPVPQRAATIERFLELLRMAHQAPTPITMMPGVATMLAALTSRGWAVALATGAWRLAAEYKLNAAGLSFAGMPLATSEDGPARVMIVMRAIARATATFGVEKFARVVVIGDGVWDVCSAAELALPFVGLGAGERADRLRRVGASHILTDYLNVDQTIRAFETAQIPRAAF